MCLKPKQTVDNLNRDVVYETYTEELDKCDYVDYGDSIKVNGNDLVVMQLNIRGLYSKLARLKDLLNVAIVGKKPDILLLCETWQSNNSPLPILDGYELVCKNRTHKLGGGVCIFISKKLKFKTRADLEIDCQTIEHCIIEVQLKRQNVLLFSGYRAPSQSPTKFLQDYDKLNASMNGTGLPVIIGMDHNLDLLKLKTHQPTKLFVDKLLDSNMVPSITKPTRITKSSATLIDNIFIPLELAAISSSYIIVEDISDHLPTLLVLNGVNTGKTCEHIIESRDLRPKRVNALRNEIGSVEWNVLLSNVIPRNDTFGMVIPQSVAINDVFDNFHDKLQKLIDKNVPIRRRLIKESKFRREPWLTNGLTISISKSKRLYKASIMNGASETAISKYKTYRNRLNKLKRMAKTDYYRNLCTSLKSNTKKLWEIINRTLGKESNKTCVIDKLKIGNVMYNNPNDISNELASYFASVGSNYAKAIPTSKTNITKYLEQLKRNDRSIFIVPTDKCEIEKLITSLPNKNSSGFDLVNNKLLKLIKVEIATPLEIVFNQSIECGIFPDKMKLAEVVPLYKGKSRLEPSNYRPISLLPTISKILEKIMYRRTYNFLNDNNQLYHSQYGFRAKHSCEHAIADLVGHVLKNQQQNRYTAALFLDLSKAFDTLNHTLLLKKLEIYGIRGVALDWFNSYLSGRKMRVKNKCHDNHVNLHSSWFDLTHGAPQGSCLGPLLFLIFCNDLSLNLNYLSCIQFADDTTLYYADKNLDVLKCCVEHDLNIILDWFRANSLTLNVQKTNFLLFAPDKRKHALYLNVDKVTICPSNNTKFLGVILDDKLEWTEHVKSILTKMKRNYNLMRLGANLLSKHSLKIVYYAHVYSHLSYCISIWGSMTSVRQITKLKIQQDKCMRLIDSRLTTDQVYVKYKILQLDHLIDLELCKMGFKLRLNELPVNLLDTFKSDSKGDSLEKTHRYNTRQKNEPNLPSTSSKKYHQSFLFQGIKRYSTLPSKIKSITKYNKFISALKNEYLT